MTNADTMERMGDGFARRDVDAILDRFADDGVFDLTQGPDPYSYFKQVVRPKA